MWLAWTYEMKSMWRLRFVLKLKIKILKVEVLLEYQNALEQGTFTLNTSAICFAMPGCLVKLAL